MFFKYLGEVFKSHLTFNRSAARDIRNIIKRLLVLDEQLHSKELSVARMNYLIEKKDGSGILVLLSNLYTVILKSRAYVDKIEDLLTRLEIKLFRKSSLINLLDYLNTFIKRTKKNPELNALLGGFYKRLIALRKEFFEEAKDVVYLLRAEVLDQKTVKSLLVGDSIVAQAVNRDWELRSLMNHISKDSKHLIKELKKSEGFFEKNDIRSLKKHTDELQKLFDTFIKDMERSLNDILFLFKVAVHLYFKISHKAEELFKGYEHLLKGVNYPGSLLTIIDDALDKREKELKKEEKRLELVETRLARKVA